MSFKIRDYQHPIDAAWFLEVTNTWQIPPLTLEQYLQREEQRPASEQPLEKILLEVNGLTCGFVQVNPHSFVPPGWVGLSADRASRASSTWLWTNPVDGTRAAASKAFFERRRGICARR